MLVPFLIMMREGIEAALIVGIVAGYVKQSGSAKLLPAVWAGVIAACLLCVAVGFGLHLASAEFPVRQQAIFEAVVRCAAAGILTSMVFWMKTAARTIKGRLQGSIEAALRGHAGRHLALVGIAFFAVVREGLESVLFLFAVVQQSSGYAVPLGAFAGLLVAVAVGVAIYQGTARLNLGVFFRWTGVFILFVAAGLMAGSVHALHEAGVWNGLQPTAFDLSTILPADGVLGSLLAGLLGYQDAPTVGEVLAYLGLLIPALLFFLIDTAPFASMRKGA